jgi:hypothetical protein
MGTERPTTYRRVVLRLVLAAAPLAGCDEGATAPLSRTVLGSARALGNGQVRSFVDLGADGSPSRIGVVFDEAAMDGLPQADGETGGHGRTRLILDLPEEAEATPFRQLLLGWNPEGHAPEGVYELPHFDVHFFTITSADREVIRPADPEYAEKVAAAPPPGYLPPGYVRVLGGVPLEGQHWADGAAPELNGERFTATMLWGTYDARVVFIEPMMTRERILSGQAVEETMLLPGKYGTGGYWPTTTGVAHDADVGVYRVYLGGLTERPAG